MIDCARARHFTTRIRYSTMLRALNSAYLKTGICMLLFQVLAVSLPAFAEADFETRPKPEAQASPQAETVRERSGEIAFIERLSNEIVRTELKLTKISTEFHAAWLKPRKCKVWRVFAYKIAGSGLTNAGIICIAGSRFQYMRNPTLAPAKYLKAGHIINITAASIIMGGTIFELFADHRHRSNLKKHDFDPESSLVKFLELRKELDKLLDTRAREIGDCDELTDSQKQILQCDGKVLKNIRDLISAEFYYSFIEIARLKASLAASSAETIAGAALSGYLGSLNALLSVANKEPKQIGVAGIGFITNGSVVATAPLLTKLARMRAEKSNSNMLGALDISPVDNAATKLEENCQCLNNLLSSASVEDRQLLTAIDARTSAYRLHKHIYDTREHARVLASAKSKPELLGRLFVSSIVGGTNIARGTQLAVAGFKYYDSKTDIFKLVASASTAYIAGSGVWTADNIQGRVRELLLERKLAKAKLGVHARLLGDLENLDNMERQMSLF